MGSHTSKQSLDLFKVLLEIFLCMTYKVTSIMILLLVEVIYIMVISRHCKDRASP